MLRITAALALLTPALAGGDEAFDKAVRRAAALDNYTFTLERWEEGSEPDARPNLEVRICKGAPWQVLGREKIEFWKKGRVIAFLDEKGAWAKDKEPWGNEARETRLPIPILQLLDPRAPHEFIKSMASGIKELAPAGGDAQAFRGTLPAATALEFATGRRTIFDGPECKKPAEIEASGSARFELDASGGLVKIVVDLRYGLKRTPGQGHSVTCRYTISEAGTTKVDPPAEVRKVLGK